MKQQSGQPALQGLRVVEFAHLIAGPFAGTLLADLGADVVHVEAPIHGDPSRTIGPNKDGSHLWWKVAGRNKRSVTLDIRRAEAREVIKRLVGWADVVITNLRPSTLEEMSLDFKSLRVVNPRLIYLQVSGYGADGSMKASAGLGKMGEARSGVVYLTGYPDSPPVHAGFSHGDAVTGLMGAFGVAAALYRRANDPEFSGEWIDLALFESLFRLIEWQIVVYDQLGMIPERQGNRPSVAPAVIVNSYKTADGSWLTVTTATPKAVKAVIDLIGLNWDDFPNQDLQAENVDLIDKALGAWVAERTIEECIRLFEQNDIVASRIFSARDIVEDQIYQERGDILSVEDRDLGTIRMQAVVPKLHSHPGAIWRTGPRLGEDRDLVLKDWLKMTEAEVAELERNGVV
jgi:formyl-CoA transferase